MARLREETAGIRPRFIPDYLKQHGAYGEVRVRPGAWNTGWHDGIDFVQWTGSRAQRDALTRIREVSKRLHNREQQLPTDQGAQLEQARYRLLRAQTSCNLFWGEAWVHRCHGDLDGAEAHLAQAS